MEVTGRKAETQDKDTAESMDKLCELCRGENKTIRADGICRECEECMCQTCFGHHLKAKSCRDHVLTDTSQLAVTLIGRPQNVEKCEQHDNEKIKFYCRTHASVGCGECMVLGHNTCKPEYIKDLAKHFQDGEEFNNLIKKLEKFEAGNKDNEKIIQENRRDNKLMDEKALKEIRKFRIDINNYLDKAEADILSEAKKLTTKNEKLMAELEKHVKYVESEIEKVKEKFDTQLHQGNVLFIHTVKCKQKLGTIENTLVDVQSKNVATTFAFTPDKELCGIVTAAKKLGSFSIVSDNQTPRSLGVEPTTNKSIVRAERTKSKEERAAMFVVGARVRRGPDWNLGYEDGNEPGTVKDIYGSGQALVKWDRTGEAYWYRAGINGAFDLKII